MQDHGDVTLETGVSPDDADVAIEEAVAQTLAGGQAALLMGGDHSVTFPAIRAIAAHCRTALHPERLRELPIAIVHFDAHPVRRMRYLLRAHNCTPLTAPFLMVSAFAIRFRCRICTKKLVHSCRRTTGSAMPLHLHASWRVVNALCCVSWGAEPLIHTNGRSGNDTASARSMHHTGRIPAHSSGSGWTRHYLASASFTSALTRMLSTRLLHRCAYTQPSFNCKFLAPGARYTIL